MKKICPIDALLVWYDLFLISVIIKSYLLQKKKLKNTAIPTLNGPLCTDDRSVEEIQNKQGTELPINIDDIENEFLANSDKRAHFSVKYGDFLINDFPEGITLNLNPYPVAMIKQENSNMLCNRFDRNSNLYSPYNNSQNSNKTVVKKNVSPKKPRIKANSKILPKINKELPSNPQVVSIEFEELNLYPTKQDKITQPNQSITLIQPNTLQPNSDNITDFESYKTQLNESIQNTKKVKIISEKLISEPVKISKGELQPVSPSIVINVPKKKSKNNIMIEGQDIKTVYLDKMLPLRNEQLFQNSSNMSTQIGAQLGLHEYGQPTMIVDQNLCLNNTQTLEDITCSDAKPMDYVTSDAYQNSQMLKQKTEMFSNIENNMSTVPNVEFVSSSLTGPSVFTLVNVPPVTMVNNSDFAQEVSFADVDLKNVSLPTKSVMVSTEQVPALITLNDSLNKAKNDQTNVYEKQITSKSSSPSKSLVKSKMPPEKLAAIEKKRKYNMKLRDIIHSCLNNMEEEPDIGKLTVALKKEIDNKKVGDHLAEVSRQPGNVIAYFENRLKRMEDLLSNKIEQNSQKIADLKKTVKSNTSKKSVSTQTYQNAEETKKSLYQQMSQYLSSEANSLIYEELFINQSVSKKYSLKKRKHR